VTAPVQYGPRITAIILYLYVGQFLSKKRTAQALAELFGTPVSEGTVAAMTERAAGGLGGFLDVVRDRIADSEVAGFDETGLRVASSLHWVHCARTCKFTLITCHIKRGRKGSDDAGVLGRFTGVAVHDAWAPYDTYLDPAHQLCCAHAVRELQGVADTAPPDTEWCWATTHSATGTQNQRHPLRSSSLALRQTDSAHHPAWAAGRSVSFCLAFEVVEAFTRDVGRGVFLWVLDLVEFPGHPLVFVKAVVVPGLFHCGLSTALLETTESGLCALGFRLPHIHFACKQVTLVCSLGKHDQHLPPASAIYSRAPAECRGTTAEATRDH
jgi:hypothetical protein